MQLAARLFGPFQRLHDSTRFAGSGSGLFFASGIVNRGRIWAETLAKQGATFRFNIGPSQEVSRARNL
jgi:light-regulated signal transduction histidine kinase (bacteriophytochrome)